MLISILKFLILCYDRLYESHKVFVSFYELWGIMKQKEYYSTALQYTEADHAVL